MSRFLGTLVLAMFAGIAGANAQAYPTRPITLVVPFLRAAHQRLRHHGGTDAACRSGSRSAIENVGGAGGSIGVGRRACGAGRLHLRHRPMGYPCRQHHLQARLRSRKGFRADRAGFQQSATDGRQDDLPANTLGELVDLDAGQPRQDQFRQPERGGQCLRRAVQAPYHEGAVHSLSPPVRR